MLSPPGSATSASQSLPHIPPLAARFSASAPPSLPNQVFLARSLDLPSLQLFGGLSALQRPEIALLDEGPATTLCGPLRSLLPFPLLTERLLDRQSSLLPQ